MEFLKGKVAIVTGAGRGIGRAIALTLADAGISVAILSRTESEVQETAKQILAKGGNVLPIVADVTESEQIRQCVNSVIQQWGRIHILVNNAGFARFKPFIELTLDEWNQTLNVNLTGTFIVTKAVVPHMIEHKEGIIINISSVSGLRPIPNQSAYCASKHGVNGLTTTLAMELKPYNIRVHAICPGGVLTRLSEENMPERDKSDWMLPEDVAHTVMYFLTQHPRATTDIIYLRRYGSVPLGG
ncbi:MAG TPA: SDR family oxidoreductase [Candidatus Hydrogenedens sp.]|nr:SDR family oxidoreductase [Candidatus Hydrogenedens sp.]HPP58440.1 SDR family oxidoreductase [Candidatus Hydrogenedens sp.]